MDEGFIRSLRDRQQLRDDEHYYAFSEFADSDAPWFEDARGVDKADGVQVPYGMVHTHTQWHAHNGDREW